MALLGGGAAAERRRGSLFADGGSARRLGALGRTIASSVQAATARAPFACLWADITRFINELVSFRS